MDVEELPMHKDTYFFGYGIDIEKPDEMARQITKLKEENQELKQQLHESSLEMQRLIEQDRECPSNCSKLKELNKSLKASRRVSKHHLNRELDLENQQKEFIEWLEERIKATEDKLTKYNELVIQGKETDTEYYLSIIDERELDTYEKVLSKYKEIIGGLND